MTNSSAKITSEITDYLKSQEKKTLLRFITCGSVDDGKSTLIGRLLFESKALLEDQMAALEKDSKKWGTQGGELDFALLVDGLSAEREQGITIDVAYRFFSTSKRKFIVADTPGHEQYTRNMVTGASTADVAIVLIDARKGLLQQTRRHSFIVSLLGIKHILVVVNKMDLVSFSEEKFTKIKSDYVEFANKLNLKSFEFLPMSALKGDNVALKSPMMAWYQGPTLIEFLESVEVDETIFKKLPFRFPVQWVNRANMDFRGFSGTIASGTIKPGTRVRVQPSGKESRVERIVTQDGDLSLATAGQAVTITLSDEIDISRGNMISVTDNPAEISNQFQVVVIWMQEEAMLPGRSYFVKIGTSTVGATFTEIKHEINVNSLEKKSAKFLGLNAIAVCNLTTDRAIAFDSYQDNKETGSFIIIDRMNFNTVGAGLINFSLRRASNIHIHSTEITKVERSLQKHQKSCVLWLTGLSGAGKSTIANLVEKKLYALGNHTYLLDGDNVRHGLNKDLGFTAADRVENIRRVAEVSKLMVEAGLIVITAFISPFKAERELARRLLEDGEFLEIFLDIPLPEAEKRDPKGLYKKARRGELANFTGIDSPYEPPQAPTLKIDTSLVDPEKASDLIIELLKSKKIIV